MSDKNFSQHATGAPQSHPKLPDEAALKFLKFLEETRAEDISCTDTYARIEEFVERELTEHDAEKIMPLIREHLDHCAECCDEYEALLDALAHTQDGEK